MTSIDEARQAMLSSPSTEGKARAKYKFKGETQLELSFNKVSPFSCKIYLVDLHYKISEMRTPEIDVYKQRQNVRN